MFTPFLLTNINSATYCQMRAESPVPQWLGCRNQIQTPICHLFLSTTCFGKQNNISHRLKFISSLTVFAPSPAVYMRIHSLKHLSTLSNPITPRTTSPDPEQRRPTVRTNGPHRPTARSHCVWLSSLPRLGSNDWFDTLGAQQKWSKPFTGFARTGEDGSPFSFGSIENDSDP